MSETLSGKYERAASRGEVNRARRLIGIGPVISKMRACLKCLNYFKSHCYANRLCERCKNTNGRND